ncbi:MAG: transposase [Clostridiaceae bacterium]|nr:transposase [Clostridiaceae bacterium]
MDKLVESFDLYSLGFLAGKNDETGRPKYSPQDMLKLYIYGYYNGIRSSRKLQKQAVINREVIWLLKGLQPKQRAISDLRKENTVALKQVFEVFVDFCNEIGLYGKALVAIDGIKI